MIAYGLLVTVVGWVSLWCVGETAARLLFGRRAALVTAATRAPLGLAAALCLLEGAGYFLPIRVAVWFVVAAAVLGAALLFRAPRRVLGRDAALAAVSLGALLFGLVPVIAAGRFTAAALTNNDGTYYITTAEWLQRVAWRAEYPTWEAVPEPQCMTETVLHLWYWRTGTPNLMAAVSALSGLGSPASLAVVTALLFGCVPCAAIGVARGLGAARSGPRELAVGSVAASSAATAFLGFQHMTGHLGVASLFPAACGAAIAVARRGGWRRAVHVAAFFAASVALFADGAAALLVIAGVALVAGRRRLGRAITWTAAAALATAAVAPFTLARAARAAWNTVRYRVPSQRIIFPQRGWLPRSFLDDLSTLTGVDPWPPWPAPSLPSPQTLVEWCGALSGIVLLAAGALELRRRRDELSAIAVLAGSLFVGVVFARVHYLQGKVLLTGAVLAAPLCGVGVARFFPRRYGFLAWGPFAVAHLVALAQLVRPSAFKVVDTAAEDALVPELAKLPRGSLLALDGLGAPADVVLDEHRAERAARLAGLLPMQPGLDGGFYTPVCRDVKRPAVLPDRAYALQRTTSETLTRGATLAQWAQFRIVKADLSGDGFIAAWAPTHGWLGAEHDRDGRVCRWAEWTSQGTLRAVAGAPCARLDGETRVVDGSAALAIRIDDATAFEGNTFADWTSFQTVAFSLLEPLTVSFTVTRASAVPPDAAHALAVSKLTLVPVEQCGIIRREGRRLESASLPVELTEPVELRVAPPLGAACYDVALHVDADGPASLRLTIDGSPPSWHYVERGGTTLGAGVFRSATEQLIGVLKGGSPPGAVRITGFQATPRSCRPDASSR
ncbi:MAG TPA: hypothetical protein VHU80_12595 [Polyangiaceae bacterium]|nr:hypothetical protein [Polyangiaceae bacterium]